MKQLLKSEKNVKLTLCFLTLFFFISTFTMSQTYISGLINSNTTWTKANSPYIVIGNTIVMPTVVLNIEPGVEVKLYQNVQFILRGTLIGFGTIEDTIRFTSYTSNNPWYGFSIDNLSYNPKVNLRYFKGSFANYLFDIISYNTSVDTLIKTVNCSFEYNFYVFNDNDEIKTHKVVIDSCVFTNNILYCGRGISNYIIKNSKFIGGLGSNDKGFYNSANQNTIIDYCEFSGFKEWAVCVNGSVTNSIFFNNNKAICTQPNNSPILHYNNIHDNQIGIEDWTYSSINPPTQITNNRICNNAINLKKIYHVDSRVINNCWCLQDSAQIEATIYDIFDGPNLGMVYFIPFDTNCTHIEPYVNFIENTESSFNIFPNPVDNNLIINVKLKTASNIQITVFDLLGNIVNILYKGFVDASEQELYFNIRNITSGIYYLSITSDKGKIIKKIVKQ